MKLHPKNLIAVFLLAFLAFVLSCQQEEFVPLNISSVSPSEVLIGDTVTLSGAGFSPDYATNRVTFSGAKKPLAPIRGSTTEKLVLVVPDSAETGPLHVNILNEEFFSSPSLTVLVPLFESITPANGFAGDTVIIRGKNFRSDKNHNHVFFKAKITHTVEVISSTSTELHVIVPEAAIPGNISVLGYTGPSFSLKAGKITGIYPRQGIVGDTITVTGVGFPPSIASIPPYAVQFNSVSPPLEVKEFPNDFIPTTREVRVIVPVGTSNGKVKMIYGVAGAQVTLVSDSAFQIYPSITGYSSPGLPPGALLTIQGNSFKPKPGNANVVNVTLNGVVLKKQGTFDNENITVLIPVGATSGSVVVNANGRIATGPMFEVLAATAPVINKLTPNTQFVDQPIIIEGVNFSAVPADNIVTFSPNIELTGAQILMASATQLKVNVPEGAVTGTIKVKVKGVEAVGSPTFTLKGGGPGGTDFTITAINPTSREQKQTINITGTNFTNAGGEIGVYITETFGNGSSFLLKDLNIVSATEMTATVDTYFNPVNQQPIIYTSGQYKVSVRYLSTPTEDKSNNDKILTVEGLTPVLSSFTPTIVKAGDELTITGKYFEGVLANNQVIFIKDGIETVAVAKAVGNGTPVDGFTTMVVVVPTLVAGNYQVKVKSTTSGKISNQMPLTVEADVVTTFTPKPVYFLGITGTGTSQSVHLNKISPSAAGPTITTIYSVPADADRGITAMTFDLKPALDDSRVYFSQNSSEIDDNDGIFSRKLTGSAAKKRIIKTQILNEVGYGSGVADLTLDVANNRLFWP